MGNEGVGLSDEVISESDYVVKIPMAEGGDSFWLYVESHPE